MTLSARKPAAFLEAAERAMTRFPGPVFWNEIRYSFLRGRATGWVLGATAAACGLAFCAGAAAWSAGATEDQEALGRRLFLAVSLVMSLSLFVAGPAFSCGAFVAEKNRRTFDLLLSSGLSPWELAAGKMASAFARTAACLLAGLPCLLAAQALGGVGAWEIPKHLLFFGSWIALEVAVGVSLSMFFRSLLLTALSTYVAAAVVFLATLIARQVGTLNGLLPGQGFWVLSVSVNLVLAAFLAGGALLLLGPLAKWDF
jgi:ABC-type transport system involved in multi-copper enzyme maturation permease subunit